MKNGIATLIIVLLALTFMLYAPAPPVLVVRAGITPTSTPGAGQETPTPRPTPTAALESGAWLPVVTAANNE